MNAEPSNADVRTRNAEEQGVRLRPRDLRERTQQFALDVIRLVDCLPRSRAGEALGKQLLRSGTSVAANYRAARRARSRKEVIAKLGIVEEEADESEFWLEMLLKAGVGDPEVSSALAAEAHQLVAIIIASIRTARGASRYVPRSALRVPR